MPHVRRKTYSRPIPANAVETTTKDRKGRSVPAVRFRGPDGRQVVAPLVTTGPGAGNRCLVPSPCWYGTIDGNAVKLTTSKAASEVMLADLLRKRALGQAGMLDPHAEHADRPLEDHLQDFRLHLESRGGGSRYIEMVLSRLTSLFDGCGWQSLTDLDADQALAWLQGRRSPGKPAPLPPGRDWYTIEEIGDLLGIRPASVAPLIRRHHLPGTGQGRARRFPRSTVEALLERRNPGSCAGTTNQYLTHLKGFSKWLVRGRKIPQDPFQYLGRLNEDADQRHARRELSVDELRRLLEATRASPRCWRGLTGTDRYHLYLMACGTGFRAGGLASLTPECFDLDGTVPVVTLPVRTDKSKRGKLQPLPSDVADQMRGYLQGKPRGKPVWPGTWATMRTAAPMLRGDLEAAGIPYMIQGPDGPEYADFHALRHTYLTLGGRAGIDLRTLQELAGHSTPTLTARYSHRRLHDLAGAVRTLPSLLPQGTEQTLKATGTDGYSGPAREAVRLPDPCQFLARTTAGEEGSGVARSGEKGNRSAEKGARKPLRGRGKNEETPGIPGVFEESG